MNLSEADTEELIDELLERFDHAAFIGGAFESVNFIRRCWKGNTHTVVGLLRDLEDAALQDYRERETDTN